MPYRRNQGRPLFLAYLCSAWVAILMAAPLVWALEPASAGASRASAFHAADANGDGRVSPAEAARLPGLSAWYERADANGDGVLDRFEFRRALSLRDGR
jgi:hypothetical protein